MIQGLLYALFPSFRPRPPEPLWVKILINGEALCQSVQETRIIWLQSQYVEIKAGDLIEVQSNGDFQSMSIISSGYCFSTKLDWWYSPRNIRLAILEARASCFEE